MDSILRVLKYSVTICIKIELAVPADRPHTGATTLDLENAPISKNEMEALITNHVKEYVLTNTWW